MFHGILNVIANKDADHPPCHANPTHLRLVTLLVLATLILCGCGGDVRTQSLSAVARQDANQHMATRVDLVLVMSAELVTEIGGLDARVWFSQKPVLMAAHPGGLKVASLQLPPGDRQDDVPLPTGGVALFVFADYLSPGVHRHRIDAIEKVQLVLQQTGISIVSQ